MTDDRTMPTIVEKLRPVTSIDDHWPAAARDTALAQLLAAAGRPEPFRRSRRRRVLLTAALTAGLVSSGAGLAAAGGLMPESFTKGLSFWTSETGGTVNVQKARRVAQAPGPEGKVLSVWSARGRDGTLCVSPIFEPPGDLGRPAPASFRLTGGQCAFPGPRASFGDGGGSADVRGVHTMWAAAGNAVRAELRLSDGTTRPALHAEGMFFFWYLADEKATPPTLVGYDATGNVLKRMPLPNLNDPVHDH